MEEKVDNLKPGIIFPTSFDPRSIPQPGLLQPRGVQLREINPAGFSLQEEDEAMDPFLQVLHLLKAISFDNRRSKQVKHVVVRSPNPSKQKYEGFLKDVCILI